MFHENKMAHLGAGLLQGNEGQGVKQGVLDINLCGTFGSARTRKGRRVL